jgi:hypothetical protein
MDSAQSVHISKILTCRNEKGGVRYGTLFASLSAAATAPKYYFQNHSKANILKKSDFYTYIIAMVSTGGPDCCFGFLFVPLPLALFI